MIQFTPQQVECFRSRLQQDDSIIIWLQKQVQQLMDYGIKVPEQGIATWQLFYFCPKHSVQLIFNINEPLKHVCPVDGEVFNGEPYDGAWWRILNEINAQGCYYFGLLWLFTQDIKYQQWAKEILREYARYYPDYEVHGGIPYNEPGKANAQTLCEAIWLQFLANGYDLISDSLSMAEKRVIEDNLLTLGAEFLTQHRTNQLHNHEVIINAGIGVLGILLGRNDLVHFAVNTKYGLIYQLENAVLKDHCWFEGSLHYHIFALVAFFAYEKFAYNTPYRLNHLELLKMMEFPLNFVQPDNNLPLLNDAIYGENNDRLEAVYEFGFREYDNPGFCWLLNRVYQEKSRQNNLEAFLYGVEHLPSAPELRFTNYHDEIGSGLTIFRGPNQQYLLVKHGPFGGEHDHYDRLGISYLAFGERIAPDLGTTGYGANLHYDYYKNTGSHNTVVINQENQPPANGKVLKFWEGPDYTLLDTEVKWDGNYSGLDSHTIVQWDKPSYEGVTMRRIILWCEQYFIEVFKVDGVRESSIDWVLHVPGKLGPNSAIAYPGVFSIKKPFKYLKNVQTLQQTGVVKSNWLLQNCRFNLYSYCIGINQLYYGDAPDNPSIRDISYFINRVNGKEALFVNLFEAVGLNDRGVENIECQVDRRLITINVIKNGKQTQYDIPLDE
jgi:hypothetical protein